MLIILTRRKLAPACSHLSLFIYHSMADSLDDSAAPEGTKTFASRTSNKGKDENQGALAKNVINPLVNFAKTSAVFVANCKRPEDQRK